MPYLKRTWTEATPINTTNLQSIEDGIAARFQYRRAIGGGDDWNTITQEGVYKVALLGSNAPAGAYTYGALVVFTDEANMIQQMYFPHDTDSRPYTRIKYNATDWQPWLRLANATHSHAAADLPSGTTGAKGIVQLTSTISTSTTLAATPNAVKTANDNANTRVFAGASNGDISQIMALLVNMDTRGLHVTARDANGKITQVEERDGAVLLRLWTMGRNVTDGKIDVIYEEVDGYQITHTINRGADRKITSITKTVG